MKQHRTGFLLALLVFSTISYARVFPHHPRYSMMDTISSQGKQIIVDDDQLPKSLQQLIQLKQQQNIPLSLNEITRIEEASRGTLSPFQTYSAKTLSKSSIASSTIYLPSIVMIDSTTRDTYKYNSKGKVTQQLDETYSNNTWTPSWRDTLTYDSNNNRLTELYESYDNNTWTPSSRYTLTYDSNNNELTFLSESFSNNTWNPLWRYTYTYDSNNNRLTSLYECYVNNTSVRYTYTYDSNNNRLTELDETYSNNTWTPSWRYTLTYDSNNKLLTELDETYSNNTWTPLSRYTYTYDSNNNRLTELDETYSNNTWTPSSRYTYTYDSNNNRLTSLYESYDNNTWTPSWRYTYTYDSNNNYLTELYETYSNSAWTTNYLSTYTYDSNGNAISGTCSGNGNGNITMYYNNRHWSIGFSWYYHGSFVHTVSITYTSITTGISENTNQPRAFALEQNYPNPFNPSTTIAFSIAQASMVDLKVYDLLGREVATLLHETKLTGNYTVPFNAIHLASGVYFYKLQAGNFTSVKKLVLLK